MSLRLEEAHQLENDLKRKLKKKDPEHPALKIFYHSTYEAIDAYNEALL